MCKAISSTATWCFLGFTTNSVHHSIWNTKAPKHTKSTRISRKVGAVCVCTKQTGASDVGGNLGGGEGLCTVSWRRVISLEGEEGGAKRGEER